MYGGSGFDWATLVFAWLTALAIGLAIYFLPIARLLNSLTRVATPTSADAVASRSLAREFFLRRNGAPSSKKMGDKMVEILQFSRETAFTPEGIQILAAALDEAWESLRQSGSRLARPAYSRAMREVVAQTHHGNGPAWRPRS